HDFWSVEKKGQTIRIPAKESVLRALPRDELVKLANQVKRGNKMIYGTERPATLMAYIRQRVLGDFASAGVSIYDDTA
ncbi:hypothetical protein EBR66_08620, partial [bacterium]|nr:hypothetical protein [bacterium]